MLPGHKAQNAVSEAPNACVAPAAGTLVHIRAARSSWENVDALSRRKGDVGTSKLERVRLKKRSRPRNLTQLKGE